MAFKYVLTVEIIVSPLCTIRLALLGALPNFIFSVVLTPCSYVTEPISM